MRRIMLIATGGTIASTPTNEGLAPSIDANEILEYVPATKGICNLNAVSIMSVDSTNMTPKRMIHIAETIKEYYEDYDGFVVTHGTDTMGYTAAALTFMLEGLAKPVVITGSQVAITAPNTDAKKNLSDAILFSCGDYSGVYVAFDGIIIRGTHAVKLKTRSFDAFQSVNCPPFAKVIDGKIVVNTDDTKAYESVTLRNEKTLHLRTNLCEDVFVLKLFPGIQPSIFEYIKENYKGVIIESFGIGGIPSGEYDITLEVSKLVEAGIAVVITTQCLYEGIDLNVYAVGKKLATQSVIYAADMTTEAITMKLMLALGNYQSLKEIKSFMETPYCLDRSY